MKRLFSLFSVVLPLITFTFATEDIAKAEEGDVAQEIFYRITEIWLTAIAWPVINICAINNTPLFKTGKAN